MIALVLSFECIQSERTFVSQYIDLISCQQSCSQYHDWSCKRQFSYFVCEASQDFSCHKLDSRRFRDLTSCLNYCPTNQNQYCHHDAKYFLFQCFKLQNYILYTQLNNDQIIQHNQAQQILNNFSQVSACQQICQQVSINSHCQQLISDDNQFKYRCVFHNLVIPKKIELYQLFSTKLECQDYCSLFYHWKCFVLSRSLYYCQSYEQLRLEYNNLHGLEFASNLSQCQWICASLRGFCTYVKSLNDYQCFHHQQKNLVGAFQYVNQCRNDCSKYNGSCLYFRYGFGDHKFFCQISEQVMNSVALNSSLYDYDEEDYYSKEQYAAYIKQKIYSMLYDQIASGNPLSFYYENDTFTVNGITFNHDEIFQQEYNGPQ